MSAALASPEPIVADSSPKKSRRWSLRPAASRESAECATPPADDASRILAADPTRPSSPRRSAGLHGTASISSADAAKGLGWSAVSKRALAQAREEGQSSPKAAVAKYVPSGARRRSSLKQATKAATELELELERAHEKLEDERKMKQRFALQLKAMEEQARHAWAMVSSERARASQLDEEARGAVEATINDAARDVSQLLTECAKLRQENRRLEAGAQGAQATADITQASLDIERAKTTQAERRVASAETHAATAASVVKQLNEKIAAVEEKAARAE